MFTCLDYTNLNMNLIFPSKLLVIEIYRQRKKTHLGKFLKGNQFIWWENRHWKLILSQLKFRNLHCVMNCTHLSTSVGNHSDVDIMSTSNFMFVCICENHSIFHFEISNRTKLCMLYIYRRVDKNKCIAACIFFIWITNV